MRSLWEIILMAGRNRVHLLLRDGDQERHGTVACISRWGFTDRYPLEKVMAFTDEQMFLRDSVRRTERVEDVTCSQCLVAERRRNA